MYEDPVRTAGSDSCHVYMSHTLQWPAQSLRFCPFEDVLGVGHAQGFSSLLVPGTYLSQSVISAGLVVMAVHTRFMYLLLITTVTTCGKGTR